MKQNDIIEQIQNHCDKLAICAMDFKCAFGDELRQEKELRSIIKLSKKIKKLKEMMDDTFHDWSKCFKGIEL